MGVEWSGQMEWFILPWKRWRDPQSVKDIDRGEWKIIRGNSCSSYSLAGRVGVRLPSSPHERLVPEECK